MSADTREARAARIVAARAAVETCVANVETRRLASIEAESARIVAVEAERVADAAYDEATGELLDARIDLTHLLECEVCDWDLDEDGRCSECAADAARAHDTVPAPAPEHAA